MQSAILFYQFCLSVCLSVPLSVCLSVQCQYSVKTNGRIATLSRRSDSGIVLLFSALAVTKFQEEPLSGGRFIQGGENSCAEYRHLSRNRYEIGL